MFQPNNSICVLFMYRNIFLIINNCVFIEIVGKLVKTEIGKVNNEYNWTSG